MIVYIDEASMVNILSFSEVAKIERVQINMNTLKWEFINIHIQNMCIPNFRSCWESLFDTNLDEPSMLTGPISTSVNPYYLPTTMKHNSNFFTDSEVEGARNF